MPGQPLHVKQLALLALAIFLELWQTPLGLPYCRAQSPESSLVVSSLVAIGTNLYEYGLGEEKDKGVGSQEFWVSTGVDSESL